MCVCVCACIYITQAKTKKKKEKRGGNQGLKTECATGSKINRQAPGSRYMILSVSSKKNGDQGVGVQMPGVFSTVSFVETLAHPEMTEPPYGE
jgi:hypothetical protein